MATKEKRQVFSVQEQLDKVMLDREELSSIKNKVELIDKELDDVKDIFINNRLIVEQQISEITKIKEDLDIFFKDIVLFRERIFTVEQELMAENKKTDIILNLYKKLDLATSNTVKTQESKKTWWKKLFGFLA